MQTLDAYVQDHNGVFYVGASGVQLYGVIAMWQQGFSPEEIQASFTSLTLKDVYGAILYYLEHQTEIEQFFRQQDALLQQQKAAAEARHQAFHDEVRARIARFRTAQQLPQSAVS